MSTLNTNLIIDPTGITQNGMQNIVSWYGGRPNIDVLGTFGGATVALLVCAKAPADLNTLTAADWVDLKDYTAPGFYNDYLNPCLLSAKVTGATGTTQLKVIVL